MLAKCSWRQSCGETLVCSDSSLSREVMSEQQRQGAERDLYRDTWVRYLGERGSDRRSDPTTGGAEKKRKNNQCSWVADLEFERSLKRGLVPIRLGLGFRRRLGTCPRSHNTVGSALSTGLFWRHKPSAWVALCRDRALAMGSEDLDS